MKYIPPPCEPENEVNPVMVEEPVLHQRNVKKNQGYTGSFEQEGSELAIMPLKVGEEVGKTATAADEVQEREASR